MMMMTMMLNGDNYDDIDDDDNDDDAHDDNDSIDHNNDDDHRVEQRLPPHGDVEGDVQVRFLTAGVELDIPHRWHLHQQFLVLTKTKLHSSHKSYKL